MAWGCNSLFTSLPDMLKGSIPKTSMTEKKQKERKNILTICIYTYVYLHICTHAYMRTSIISFYMAFPKCL